MSEEKVPFETIQHLRAELYGKKITLEGEGGKHTGICQFIGYNPFLPSWGLQVTLDRFPIQHVKLASIKLF